MWRTSVAGGTGNVGTFIVRALLERGATVAVPSRTGEKLREVKAHLAQHIDHARLNRLHTFLGHAGDETGAEELLQRITNDTGAPDAVVATLGKFVSAPSLLHTSAGDLQQGVRDCLNALSHDIIKHEQQRKLLPQRFYRTGRGLSLSPDA